MHRSARQLVRRGFTLVEILIVVIILGILAAIVIPQFASASESARQNAFITDLNALTKAVVAYNSLYGLPPAAASGVMPPELSIYMAAERYEKRTPMGGVWDIEVNDSGITLGVGVHFNEGSNPGDAVMQVVDSMIDDGNLATGSFRKIAEDRYYNVLLD